MFIETDAYFHKCSDSWPRQSSGWASSSATLKLMHRACMLAVTKAKARDRMPLASSSLIASAVSPVLQPATEGVQMDGLPDLVVCEPGDIEILPGASSPKEEASRLM